MNFTSYKNYEANFDVLDQVCIAREEIPLSFMGGGDQRRGRSRTAEQTANKHQQRKDTMASSFPSPKLISPKSASSVSSASPSSSSLSSPNNNDNILTPLSKISPTGAATGHDSNSNTPSTATSSPQYTKQRKQRSMQKSSWLGRQIAAAYDEHASIINDLRAELHKSKKREQALIKEFEAKFHQLQNQQLSSSALISPLSFEGMGSSSTSPVNSKLTFEDEDMPMDEMADTAREERNARQNEMINQRRILEEFKQLSDAKIHQLRQQSEKQIKSIEKALKEKVNEIDLLKQEAKKIAKERNYYKKQNSVEVSVVANGAGVTSSPADISSLGTDGNTTFGDDENGQESILINSFTLQNHATPSPLTVHKRRSNSKSRVLQNHFGNDTKPVTSTSSNADEHGEAIYNQLLSKPLPHTPQGINTIPPPPPPPIQTPTQKQHTQQQHISTSTPPTASPTSAKKQFNFSNSVIAIDGSVYESGGGVMSVGARDVSLSTSSSSPSSSTHVTSSFNDTSSKEHFSSFVSPLPTPRKLDSQQQPSFEKLIQVLKAKLSTNDSPSNNIASLDDLDDDERRCVRTIHELFRSHYTKSQTKALTTLTTKLQQSVREIQDGASKASKMSSQIQEQQEVIQLLETQLNSAHASIRNTKDLESVLRMVANDYQNDQKQQLEQKQLVKDQTTISAVGDGMQDNEMDLKRKLRDLEQERDELQTLINQTEEESARSVSAIRRVMAELSAAKDGEIEKLNTQVSELKQQIDLWGKKNNPSEDQLKPMPVLVEVSELTKLRKEARCYTTAMNEKTELQTKMEKIQLEKNELKSELKQIKNSLEQSLHDSNHMKIHFEDDINQIKKESEELKLRLQEKEKTEQKLHDEVEKAVAERNEYEKIVNTNNRSKDEMQAQIDRLKKEKELHEEQMEHTEEVLKTAKVAHDREQKLEDEMSELRNLLDRTMKKTNVLRDSLQSKEDELKSVSKEHGEKISELQGKIITVKEEKLELKKKLRTLEENSKRTLRVLSALQETGEIEKSAPQIVMDMKDHLREQYAMANDLCQTCDDKSMNIAEKLTEGFNTTLCLLNAAILGDAIFNPKATSNASHWNESAKATLDAHLNSIRKEIELELKNERDQEMTVMSSELSLIKEKNEELVTMLTKKDEEMRILRSSLKESSVGYISGDDSDLEEDTATSEMPLQINCAGLSSQRIEEILRAKDKAEKEVKENADRLANAKMIISSLEQSNKSMTVDFKSRLHDSNAAISSLLDQSGKQEKQIDELKSMIEKLRSKEIAVESELKEMKKAKSEMSSETQQSNDISFASSSTTDDSSEDSNPTNQTISDCVDLKDQCDDNNAPALQSSSNEGKISTFDACNEI